MGAASERLKTLIELSDHRLRNALAALWRHPRLDEVYPGLLLAAYSVMRGTVPVMERARDSADRVVKANGDAACAALSRYLTAHIPEERGHDQWVLDDLQALGFDRRQMEKRLPSPASAAMTALLLDFSGSSNGPHFSGAVHTHAEPPRKTTFSERIRSNSRLSR